MCQEAEPAARKQQVVDISGPISSIMNYNAGNSEYQWPLFRLLVIMEASSVQTPSGQVAGSAAVIIANNVSSAMLLWLLNLGLGSLPPQYLVASLSSCMRQQYLRGKEDLSKILYLLSGWLSVLARLIAIIKISRIAVDPAWTRAIVACFALILAEHIDIFSSFLHCDIFASKNQVEAAAFIGNLVVDSGGIVDNELYSLAIVRYTAVILEFWFRYRESDLHIDHIGSSVFNQYSLALGVEVLRLCLRMQIQMAHRVAHLFSSAVRVFLEAKAVKRSPSQISAIRATTTREQPRGPKQSVQIHDVTRDAIEWSEERDVRRANSSKHRRTTRDVQAGDRSSILNDIQPIVVGEETIIPSSLLFVTGGGNINVTHNIDRPDVLLGPSLSAKNGTPISSQLQQPSEPQRLLPKRTAGLADPEYIISNELNGIHVSAEIDRIENDGVICTADLDGSELLSNNTTFMADSVIASSPLVSEAATEKAAKCDYTSDHFSPMPSCVTLSASVGQYETQPTSMKLSKAENQSFSSPSSMLSSIVGRKRGAYMEGTSMPQQHNTVVVRTKSSKFSGTTSF
jgi:hypothetical protein